MRKKRLSYIPHTVMGKKQWKFVNGKWIATDEQEQEDIKEDTKGGGGGNNYGSLDRRLFPKKKQLNIIKKFDVENQLHQNGINNRLLSTETKTASISQSVGELSGEARGKNTNRSVAGIASAFNNFTGKKSIALKHTNHTPKSSRESLADSKTSTNGHNSTPQKKDDLNYGSLDRRLLRKKGVDIVIQKKLSFDDKAISHGVLDLRQDGPKNRITQRHLNKWEKAVMKVNKNVEADLKDSNNNLILLNGNNGLSSNLNCLHSKANSSPMSRWKSNSKMSVTDTENKNNIVKLKSALVSVRAPKKILNKNVDDLNSSTGMCQPPLTPILPKRSSIKKVSEIGRNFKEPISKSRSSSIPNKSSLHTVEGTEIFNHKKNLNEHQVTNNSISSIHPIESSQNINEHSNQRHISLATIKTEPCKKDFEPDNPEITTKCIDERDILETTLTQNGNEKYGETSKSYVQSGKNNLTNSTEKYNFPLKSNLKSSSTLNRKSEKNNFQLQQNHFSDKFSNEHGLQESRADDSTPEKEVKKIKTTLTDANNNDIEVGQEEDMCLSKSSNSICSSDVKLDGNFEDYDKSLINSISSSSSSFSEFNSSREPTERRSASPTVGRRRKGSFQDVMKKKIRSHSTGHSPDITSLLQHLICDIEEEVISDDEMRRHESENSYKKQQLDSFNSSLNEIVSYPTESFKSFSTESLVTNRNDKNRVHGRLRKTLSEDDVGLKLLRDQRAERKRRIALGDKALKRRPSVIWARVKSMEVSLIIEHDYEEPEVIKLESFDVRRVNTHKDVEELAIDTFIKHVQLLDKQALDLQKEDIQYIKLGDHKVPIGSSFDLSFAKIQDGFLPCQLCIKGKESWSLAAMSYDTLIPKSFLEKYVSLILSNQHMMFYGPSGTGKSYIARRLAAFISHRLNEGIIPPLILKDITPEKWKLLLDNLKTEKRELPYVILIDGFSQSFIKHDINLCDLVKTCKQLNPEPHIICTITETPSATIPAPWQLEFRWIWLPNHEEPIDGLLQRYLRRKFVHYGNIHLQRESFRIADWLAEVWHHVNMVIEKFNSTEATIGPSLFYTCPTDILSAEEWFVDLWNYSITPYFLLTVKQGLKLQGQRYDWEDPLEWILTTYPWISEKAKRKMKLRRIRVEDAGYQEKCPILASSLSHSNTEQQRLLEFLRQLELLMLDGELQDLPNFQTSKEKSFESSI